MSRPARRNMQAQHSSWGKNLIFQNNFKTFADILKNKPNSSEKAPPLIVTPKDKNDVNISEKFKTEFDISKTNIAINSIKARNDGSIQVKCNSEKENVNLKKELEKILTTNCAVDELHLNNPRIKIADVVNDYKLSQIILALKNQII